MPEDSEPVTPGMQVLIVLLPGFEKGRDIEDC
jgi:hypothetical protein